MTTFNIHNISFTLSEYAIEFSFTKSYAKNEWGSAALQLPSTGDSIHNILGEEYDGDDAENEAIFLQLTEFYFNSFKDTDCAAAAAILDKHILHVEPVVEKNREFYVAFTEDESFVIKESEVRSYYNKKSLFDFLDDYDICEQDEDGFPVPFTNKEDLIKTATKSYFESLECQLEKEIQDYFDVIANNENAVITEELVSLCFDEILHTFMSSEFNQFDGDYNVDKLAQEFYQMNACDIRGDFENQLRELIND